MVEHYPIIGFNGEVFINEYEVETGDLIIIHPILQKFKLD